MTVEGWHKTCEFKWCSELCLLFSS